MKHRPRQRSFSLIAIGLVSLALAACASPEEKAQRYYDQGRDLLEKHDYAKAGLEFRNALQLKKNMIEAWRGLLQVELHTANSQNIAPILQNIVELDPKDIEAELRLGRLFLAGGAVDQALELANKAMAADPKKPAVLAFHAAVLLKLDNVAEAQRQAQEALDLDKNNSDALVVLAAIRVKQNDFQGALTILDTEAAAHEGDVAIQLFKLAIYEKTGDTSRLEAQLKKLIGQFPDQIRFRQALVAFYIKQNRSDAAEKELRAVADHDPSNLQAGLDLVRLIQQLKGPEAARAELVSRMQSGGQTFKYRLALAEFDFGQGRQEDSINQLTALISETRPKEELVAAKLELAKFQLIRKNYASVSNLVNDVLKSDDRNTDALRLRGALRLTQAQYDGAINDFRQALNDQPRSSELMLLLANAYERSGSIELAEKAFADATQASSFNPAVVLNYAAFLRRRGNLDHAEDVLLEASRRTPNNVPVLSALAEVRLAKQDWAGAQQIADAIQKIKGGETIGDQIVVAALNGRGQFDQSIHLLESMHQASPSASQPITGLVNTMLRAGKADQALSFLQSVLKASPDNTQALVLLGSVHFQKREFAEAEASFQSAISKQPKEPSAYVALGQLYVTQEKLDQAEKILRSGLEQAPDNIALHQNLAIVLEQRGQIEPAIQQYEYLLQQDSGSLIAANNLASLLSDHRTDKASLDRAYALAQMLSKSPVPSFQDTLGWIQFQRGDAKGAIKLLEVAASALPTRAMVQYHLGVAYEAAGEKAKAREQFDKALKLNPDEQLVSKIKAADQKVRM